jgi:hypothetical protein
LKLSPKLHRFWNIQKIPSQGWFDQKCAHISWLQQTIANPPELHFGQEVLYNDLKCLHYKLADMHTQCPKIEEENEFPKVLNVK